MACNCDELLSVGDVARRLGCSSEAVRQAIGKGRLRAVRTIGGWRLVHRCDVDEFEKERAARRQRPH